MFGGLREKLGGFVKKLTKQEEIKEEKEQQEEIQEKKEEEKIEEIKEEKEQQEEIQEKKEEEKIEEIKEEKEQAKQKEKKEEIKEEPKKELKTEIEIEKPIQVEEEKEAPIPIKSEPKKGRIKLSLESKIKSFLSKKIKIKEKDVNDLLEDLELSLLESDINLDVAEALKNEIKLLLVDKELDKSNFEDELRNIIKQALINIMTHEQTFDLIEKINSGQKPYKILFIGPNGAGKTTTIAKISKLLENNNLSCVLSASDTFRAAAIEQLEVHGKKLNKKVIKGKYGSDPAAIAYDAVNHAKANKLDAVLIDSAGRQETNKNLIDELRKIGRIIKPDLTIYIGESIAGHSVIDQIKEFNEAVKIDGVILSKLDCDAKGGNAISIPYATNIPVIYVGVGQEYADLIKFNPRTIADEILS